MTRVVLAGLMTLAACTQVPPPTSNATLTPESVAEPLPPARNYVGRWTGVEGMVLDIAATNQPDRYRLTMQYDLDDRQTVEARLNGRELEFERDGTTRRLIPSDGLATGLKYLSDKKDCLTVAYGEGYCRD